MPALHECRVLQLFTIRLNKRSQPARKAVRELACRSSIGKLFQRTATRITEAIFHVVCMWHWNSKFALRAS